MKNRFSGKVEHLASYMSEEILPRYPEGFTFDHHKMVFPFFGPNEYLVSSNGHEGRFKLPVTLDDVKFWLFKNCQALNGKFVGGWLDEVNKEFVLDISIAVTGLDNAISIAQSNQQDAIYWFYQQEVIYIRKHEVA